MGAVDRLQAATVAGQAAVAAAAVAGGGGLVATSPQLGRWPWTLGGVTALLSG